MLAAGTPAGHLLVELEYPLLSGVVVAVDDPGEQPHHIHAKPSAGCRGANDGGRGRRRRGRGTRRRSATRDEADELAKELYGGVFALAQVVVEPIEGVEALKKPVLFACGCGGGGGGVNGEGRGGVEVREEGRERERRDRERG
jgi:hypothetical protein